MAIADFPETEELTNRTTFSSAVDDDAAPVRPDQLVVEIAHEEGEFVAVEPYTGMFGEGETEVDAIKDLLDGLRSLREVFTEKESVLSEALANRLDFLRTI